MVRQLVVHAFMCSHTLSRSLLSETGGNTAPPRTLMAKLILGERDNHYIFGLFALRHAHVPPTRGTQDARTLTKAHVSNNRIYSRNFRTGTTVPK